MKIALFKPRSIIGKIISYFTRGKYSHACVILNDESVVEAVPFRRVRHCRSIRDIMRKKDVVDVFGVEVTDEQSAIITNFLMEQIGKKYDYWSVFGFVWHATKESRKALRRWFCSEMVFAAFMKAFIELLKRVEAWLVSPTILSYSERINYLYTITGKDKQPV